MPYIVTSTTCASCTWFTDPAGSGGPDGQACPRPLWIYADESGGGGTVNLAVDFNGRGKVGGACGGSDSYVTFVNNPAINSADAYIDIWGAYRDGIWTSSTTVLVYVAATSSAASDTVYGYPMAVNANPGAYPGTSLTGAFPIGACTASLYATFTILDDGTLSVA